MPQPERQEQALKILTAFAALGLLPTDGKNGSRPEKNPPDVKQAKATCSKKATRRDEGRKEKKKT